MRTGLNGISSPCKKILKISINSRNKSNGKLEVDVNVKIRYIYAPDHLSSQVSLPFYSSLLSFPFILLLHPTVKAFQACTDYFMIEY